MGGGLPISNTHTPFLGNWKSPAGSVPGTGWRATGPLSRGAGPALPPHPEPPSVAMALLLRHHWPSWCGDVSVWCVPSQSKPLRCASTYLGLYGTLERRTPCLWADVSEGQSQVLAAQAPGSPVSRAWPSSSLRLHHPVCTHDGNREMFLWAPDVLSRGEG